MVSVLSEWLHFLEELSSASVFSIVLIFLGLLVYFGIQVQRSYRRFAKRCGAQKFLLVGYVQQVDKLSPSDALLSVNKMTKAALDDT